MGGIITILILKAVVVTSNYDLYYIVRAVADPSHEVYYLVDESEVQGEDFQLRDFHIRLLNRADVFIHTGTYERRWLARALWEARNPRILEGQAGHVDVSKYVTLYNGSNCFILSKEHIKRVATVLSGILRKLSPDFSEQFYEKRLSDFFVEVDRFFSDLSTIASMVSPDTSLYSPCVRYFAEEFGLRYKLILKKSDVERFSYRSARDAAEIMKRISSKVVVTDHQIERDSEVGFISAGISVIKIPAHLGKRYEDFRAILNGIVIVGEVPTVRRNGPRVGETSNVFQERERGVLPVPPELPRAEIQNYAYVTSRYTSVILRDRPSSVAAQAGRVAGGQRVLVLERQNEWFKITDGRSVGWVRSSVLNLEQNGVTQ